MNMTPEFFLNVSKTIVFSRFYIFKSQNIHKKNVIKRARNDKDAAYPRLLAINTKISAKLVETYSCEASNTFIRTSTSILDWFKFFSYHKTHLRHSLISIYARQSYLSAGLPADMHTHWATLPCCTNELVPL